MRFIVRWIVTALAVAAAAWILPGIYVAGAQAWVGVVLTALILALINMSIKPILQVLSLPVTILTLGIFYIVVNTLLLYLAAWIANGLFGVGFQIDGFLNGFLAAIIISIVSTIVNGITGANRVR